MERWLNEMCEETERVAHIDKNVIYRRIKQLTRELRKKAAQLLRGVTEKLR